MTVALGLGEMGSHKQIDFLKNWFKRDSAAKMLVQQRCFQSPDGASKISNFSYINFQVTGKFVTVNYLLMEYDHGKYFTTKGPDKYEIKGHEIIVLKRNIWKYIPFNQ